MTEEEKIICKSFLHDVDNTHSCNEYKLLMELLEQEPTTKNDLGVDCIDRAELLKAMNTYDKFGNDSNERLIFLSTPALQDRYVPYVHYDEMVNCVKGMPSVTPQEPRKGHWVKEESPFGWDRHSYQCSECGRSIHLDVEVEDLEDYPYCHCGAKMQEVEE